MAYYAAETYFFNIRQTVASCPSMLLLEWRLASVLSGNKFPESYEASIRVLSS